MREWIIEAVKMYYTDLLTHGVAMMVGMGLGMTIMGLTEKGERKE